ncbi:MAG: hypothetical protein Q8R76_09675 [Candidatus Omnitrophota bacterium]|nr:hypothetical protein [Candidatus Omnitrophota bacterium]
MNRNVFLSGALIAAFFLFPAGNVFSDGKTLPWDKPSDSSAGDSADNQAARRLGGQSVKGIIEDSAGAESDIVTVPQLTGEPGERGAGAPSEGITRPSGYNEFQGRTATPIRSYGPQAVAAQDASAQAGVMGLASRLREVYKTPSVNTQPVRQRDIKAISPIGSKNTARELHSPQLGYVSAPGQSSVIERNKSRADAAQENEGGPTPEDFQSPLSGASRDYSRDDR